MVFQLMRQESWGIRRLMRGLLVQSDLETFTTREVLRTCRDTVDNNIKDDSLYEIRVIAEMNLRPKPKVALPKWGRVHDALAQLVQNLMLSALRTRVGMYVSPQKKWFNCKIVYCRISCIQQPHSQPTPKTTVLLSCFFLTTATESIQRTLTS